MRGRQHPPVPHRLLPPHQLRNLVDLEAEDARPVAVRLQRNGRGAHALVTEVRGGLLFTDLPAPPALRVRAARKRAEVDRAALGRDEAGVDEEEEVREGRPKVRAVDRAVPRGLGRVDVLAAAAVELDGLLVWYVGQPDGQERLLQAEDARAAPEVASFVLLELGRAG